MAVTAMKTKRSIDSVREIVQDFLVPELKAVKVSIESLHNEMKLRDEKQTLAIQHLSEKLDFAVDVREHLASLEARVPRN
jgi:hypothetical protein